MESVDQLHQLQTQASKLVRVKMRLDARGRTVPVMHGVCAEYVRSISLSLDIAGHSWMLYCTLFKLRLMTCTSHILPQHRPTP